MKKYLITGFSGFVGKHFLEHLASLDEPASVMGIDRENPSFDLKISKNLVCSFQKADLLRPLEWGPLIGEFRPDYILHLASFSSVAYSWRHPVESFANNTNVFLNLIENVRRLAHNCRILSIGSSEEYGNVLSDQLPLKEDMPLAPLSPYAVARVSQEQLSRIYVDGFGCDIVMTRSFNHIGPGQPDTFVISSFAKQLVKIKQGRAEPVLITGDTSIVRDFVDVRDVVRAYDQLLRRGRRGQIYNVCSGIGTPLSQVIKRMSGILQIPITEKVDANLVRPSDNKFIIGSNEKIRSEIGWQPSISLDQGLKAVLEYWSGSLER